MAQVNLERPYSFELMRGRMAETAKSAGTRASASETGRSFAEVLSRQKELSSGSGLKFSRHANERLVSRNIDLTGEQRERLEGAVKKAEAKGIRESLVMLDNLAFIVNIKNSTVVTAVTGEDERIFSNIDGAVIV